jgi:hypothetical protein
VVAGKAAIAGHMRNIHCAINSAQWNVRNLLG